MAERSISFENDFPLHYLAKIGDHARIQGHLKRNSNDLFRKDFYGRSPLHYAVTTENLKDGTLCVKLIVETLKKLDTLAPTTAAAAAAGNGDGSFKFSAERRKTKIKRAVQNTNIGTNITSYLDMKDTQGDTALSLAAKNENPDIVHYLLQNSASIASSTGGNEETLALIYSNTPSAVISLLDTSVSFYHGDSDYDLIHNERKYCLNLTTLVGDSNDPGTTGSTLPRGLHGADPIFIETELLYSVKKYKIRARAEVFKHSLVQYFIETKYKKMYPFTIASVFFNLIWLALYLWQTIDIYYDCCELEILGQLGIPCADFPFDKNSTGANPEDGVDFGVYPEAREAIVNCIKSKDSLIRPIFTILLTCIVLVKEIFQLQLLRTYYFKLDNTVVCLCTVVLLSTVYPIHDWFIIQFQISAFGILLASFVILELINKLTFWGIYIKVLIQVVKRFFEIVPLFCFILLSFTVSLRMLFPDQNPPLTSFRDAMMLIFETVANGKVEWTTFYKESVDKNFYVSGFIMFIGFYLVISLLFFRILLGFVVADTKKIEQEEELNEFTSKLEHVFVIESFLACTPVTWIKTKIPIVQKFQQRFMIFSPKTKNSQNFKLILSEKEIPTRLQKDIRVLASKNITSRISVLPSRKTMFFESNA